MSDFINCEKTICRAIHRSSADMMSKISTPFIFYKTAVLSAAEDDTPTLSAAKDITAALLAVEDVTTAQLFPAVPFQVHGQLQW